MIKCKYLRIRQKNYIKYFYCFLDNKVIILDECKNCLKSYPRVNKGIKKKSNHKEQVTNKTYNYVFNRDNGKCVLCKTTKELELHHINGRSKKLTNDVNNCVMLCFNCHHKRVHKNQKKYRPILLEYIYRVK